MDNTARLEQLHDEQFGRILPTLNSYFEQKDASLSRLDPRNSRNAHHLKMTAIIPVLLRAHQQCGPEWKLLFANSQALDLYPALLDELLLFMFQSFSTTVGFGSNMEFLRCALKTYEYLYLVGKTLQSFELDQKVMSFQNNFMRNWNKAQSEIMLFDQVKDLLSHAHDFVAPPLFDSRNIVRRGYFKLTCDKFHYENLWVELMHLDNGSMAIFKVNTQTLPFHTNQQIHDLLLRLTRNLNMGAYQDPLFQIGRTLLFPTVRPMDLRVANESRNSIALETKTGNNVTLTLTPYDSLSWSTHWKPYINSLCAGKEGTVLSTRKQVDDGKEDGFKAQSTRGLGISLKKSQPKTNLDSGLRRSNPLTPDTLSISQIELMDVKKLMELNDNTDASTTDSSMRSPISTNVRHIREPSNIIEAISPVIGKQINDVDSIISDDEGDKATTPEESPVFNLSSEFHRPQLTKRKSSSFLNLFKKDKTKGARGSLDNLSKVSVAENTDTLHSDISTQPSTQSLVSKTSKPYSEESRVSCEIPSNITLDSNNVMLDTLVKVSHWKNNHWEFISSKWLQLQVINSNQGRYMFVVQDDDSNLKLCVTIGERWSVSRTTAQDIQIRFPATDSVASVVAPVPALLSVRCPQVDNIVNVLKHCKKNEVISSSTDSMTKSSTQLTLQSNSSSILSSNIPDMSFSRSSTASNELSQSLSKSKVQDSNKNCKSLLLLSKVKVRLHKYDQNYGWKMSKVGLLNVYSRENNGSVVGCKFEMEDNESFTAQTSELKRLGRTGISAGESLVEFKNQAVTDEIYNLLSAL